MLKKVIFGLIWLVVLYFLTCAVAGGIAGGIAGANDPQHAAEAGARASMTLVGKYRPVFFLGALGLAVVGTIMEWLPGTKVQRPKPKWEGAAVRPRSPYPPEAPEI